jgi:hypothetical protein
MKYFLRRLLTPGAALAALAVAAAAPAPAAATGLDAEQYLSICNQDNVFKARPRLCNTAPQPTRFQVRVSGLAAGVHAVGSCTVAGPGIYRLRQAQPVIVPAESCVDLDLEADRPRGMGLDQTSCFEIEATDLIGNHHYQSQSMVSNGGNFCGWTSDAVASVLPQGQLLPMSFTVKNPTAEPATFRYRVQATDIDGEPPVVSLNGGAAGEAHDGQVIIPAFGQRDLAVEVGLTAASDHTHQLVLTDTQGNHVLASRSFTSLEVDNCRADETTLCLGGGRFEAKAVWRDFQGNTGVGRTGGLTGDTGYFWFFNPANVEVVLKVLDGRHLNDKFWVFFGALSTVEYTITLRDTVTGETNSYYNPSGVLASVGDIGGLPGYDPTPATVQEIEQVLAGLSGAEAAERLSGGLAGGLENEPQPVGDCTPSATALCLQGGKFKVEVEWTTATSSGMGRAAGITAETGYFWFFSPNNVEVVVKVLDGRWLNDHWWIFTGSLSDVRYTVIVTDTTTGNANRYDNRQGQLASMADLEAFL